MSGHFTQRGEPAIGGKWLRAEAAVRGGADLVLELPFIFACRSAEYFARGGVGILNATGIVSHLCFGAETADLSLLQKIAVQSLQPDFIVRAKEKMRTGCTYARALSELFSSELGVPEEVIRGANNILAVEYLKALTVLQSPIQPLAIERQAAGHLDGEISSSIASATAIRREMQKYGLSEKSCRAMPKDSAKLLASAQEAGQLLLDGKLLQSLLLYRIRQLSPEQIKGFSDCSEGLEYRLKKTAATSATLEELVLAAKSRRYPATRIQRILSQLLVLNAPSFSAPLPPYLRVLAFNAQGRELIKKIRSVTVFPVIGNLPDYASDGCPHSQLCLAADINATDIYQLLLGKNLTGLDYLKPPVYVG